jgi:spermidine/putrescine transport system permease protein
MSSLTSSGTPIRRPWGVKRLGRPAAKGKSATKAASALEHPLLSAPAVVFVVLVFVVPMAVMAVYSFWPSNNAGEVVHHFTFQNYTRFFTERTYWHTLLDSFWLVGLSSVLTVSLTFPFAYFVANKVAPRHRIKWILFAIMPFWTSYLIRVFSWLNIFGESGAAAKALSSLGLIHHTPALLQLGRPAIVITFVYLLFPFAFLSSYVALERLDPSLREAGADLGARPWQVLGRLTLPLAASGLLAGFAFAFISMMGDYVTPALIGGTEGSLYANLLINQFGASGQWGFGAALALIMMVCLLVFFMAMRRAVAAAHAGEFSRRFTPSRAPFLRLYSVLFLMFLYLPIALVVLFAFNSATYVGFPIKGLTTHWFSQVLANPDVIKALETSLQIAGMSVGLAILAGVPAAIQLSRGKSRLRSLSMALLAMPLLIPPVIIGLGMILAVRAVGLQRGLWTIVLGHTLLVLPIVVLVVMARLEGLDRNQELAAMDLGARPMRALLSVVVPQAMPAIVAAAMLGFALSLDEFILTFLVTQTTTTLPLYVYSSLRFQIEPSLDAIAALVLGISFALALLALGISTGFLGRRRRRREPVESVANLLPA